MNQLSRCLVLVAFCACAPRVERADSLAVGAQSGETTVAGTVAVVGSAPVNVQVVLRSAGSRDIRLVGSLAEEIQRLSGVEIEVSGTVSDSPDPMIDRQIDVRDYRILSVDGQPVVMGEIVAIDGNSARLRTPAGEEIRVDGVPAGFAVGQKVWVQGPRSITVQTYGTIRP